MMSVKFSQSSTRSFNERDTFGNEVEYLRYCHIVARLESLEEGLTNTMNRIEKISQSLQFVDWPPKVELYRW